MNSKNNKKIIIYMIICIISIIATLSLSLNYDKDVSLWSFKDSNNFLWIIALIAIIFFNVKTFNIENKRLKICSIVLAIILTVFSLLGNTIDNYLNLSGILNNKITIIKSCIKFIGYSNIIYMVIVNIFNAIEEKKNDNPVREIKIFTNNKRSFILVWLIILLAFIPYWLTYFPGNLTSDSISQIRQAVGLSSISNHHPVLHTLIITAFIKIGGKINNYYTGVALFSAFQMLCCAAIFSYSIYYMAKKKIPIFIRIITLLFYAFYPVHAMYSITMWKDIPFAISMLLFVIFLCEMTINSEEFFKKKKNIILSIIISVLVVLFRNNGVYVYFLTAIVMLIVLRKYYKKIILICGLTLVIYFLWKGVGFRIFNIKDGSIREALSIPLQQFARVVRDREEDLTLEEKESIYKFLPVDNLGEKYYEKISDSVKSNFDDNAFEENKKEFVVTWVKLFFKYPKEYIESFLCNSYGYWYPEALHWVLSREIYQSNLEEEIDLGLQQNAIINRECYKENR